MDLGKPQTPNPEFQRVESIGAYCKAIEDYLVRKNEGHLIRIVGPSFDLVRGWAEKGIPLKVAYQGIDRCVERYYAKGPQRRPVQIDFARADVLDAFDEWKRAIGVSGASGEDTDRAKRESLPGHLERAIARLTALRSGEDRALDPLLDAVIRELDGARARAKGLRGQARAELLSRLAELDAGLLAAGRARLDADALAGLARDADEELQAFRGRMTADAYARSRAACIDRLIRDRLRLPILSLD